MQISSRFPIAVHALLCIAYFEGREKATSDFIANSVNVNPVVIRRILGQLRDAGLVSVERGVGGAHVARAPKSITLLDVFNAVESVEGDLFGFHATPNPQCPVGGSVHAVLDGRLGAAQSALEGELARTTLAMLLAEVDTSPAG